MAASHDERAPGWYPDPAHPGYEQYWPGPLAESGGPTRPPGPLVPPSSHSRVPAHGPRVVATAGELVWSGAPLTVRLLFWTLFAQGVALACGGFYGFVVSLNSPSTGSGIRELAILVSFVIVLMGLGALGVALGVRRRRARAVSIAAAMESPAVVGLPVALWNLGSRFTVEATPLLVPLILGAVAFVCAVRPGTVRWVQGKQ